MEKPRRDNLRAVVAKARRTIEDKALAPQLAVFGFFRDSEPEAKENLPLRPDQEALYPRLRDAILRQGRALGKEDGVSPEAVGRFVREAGATWVNRLAALRALEVRGLLDPPAAYVSDEYGGASPRAVKLRESASAEGRSMSRDDSIRLGLEDACRELSASVRVLFDLADEQSLLWPDLPALREVLGYFSANVTKDDWAEPDVLGWVYQYYNTDANAELKKRKNRTTGFKYKPDDIPIANQFYTPHWVVRFLADNTLGRLWLEAQERIPRLETEPYLLLEARTGVPHAANEPEAFRQWLLEEPDPLIDATVDRLCRFLVPLPSRPQPRAKKSVREIRVADTACGSGHFLLYAFDILYAIYREAEPDLDPREIPSLILENNLFGIDIDLRAAQLAAFSLFLKARTTLARIDSQARLDVRGLNIVVADAHIGNDPRKAAFLERYKDDPEVRQLYSKVLADLDHTNVLGSLLKVRTEFESLFGRVREAKYKSNKNNDECTSNGQRSLLDVARQKELTDTFRSFSGRTWTIGEMLDDLRRFERETAAGQDIGSRLFYIDLERSVGLLALLSQRYDVVLMNPPYGDMPPEAKDYLAGNKKKGVLAHYPRTAADLDAAFIDQGLELLVHNGFLGALVPWTNTFKSTLRRLRQEILCGESRPEVLQEYGYGVLDGATVGTVGLVSRRLAGSGETGLPDHRCTFDRLSDKKRDWEKEAKFLETFPGFAATGPAPEADWFVARLSSLQDVPGMPYAYWASDSLRALFRQFPPLDVDQKGVLVPGRPKDKLATLAQGMASGDNARFLRFWWEVSPTDTQWVPYLKGGNTIRFLARTDLVLGWGTDGAELKAWIQEHTGGHWSKRIYPVDYFFKPGVTWQLSGWTLRRFGVFGPGHVFDVQGSCLFPATTSPEAMVGLLNSSLLSTCMLALNPERVWHVGYVAALPGHPDTTLHDKIEIPVRALAQLTRGRHEGDETYRDFRVPELRRAWEAAGRGRPAFEALLAEAIELRRRAERSVKAKLAELDAEVFDLYGISLGDRALVGREIARRPQSDSGYSAAELSYDDDEAETTAEEADAEVCVASGAELSPERTRDLIARWLSFYLKSVLEADEDGIVPIGPTRTEPGLIVRLREAIVRDLGKDASEALVSQAPAYLGTENLGEWLGASREEVVEIGEKDVKLPVGFFPWHVDLYRKRPIFWLLSSESFERGKTCFRFQAYVHYLKLTPDTLPRLVSHYVEPVIDDYVQKEWTDTKAKATRLEGKARSAAEAEAQEWLNTLDALKSFRAALGGVIQGPPRAQRVPANTKWLARTIATVRGGQDMGHGYRPDVDYGAQVNITPLVEGRLLPPFALKKLGG